MANRTTADQVFLIMDLESHVTDEHVERFINMANSVVDDTLGDDTTLGDETKREIECNLAAHFIASTISRISQKEKLGEAQVDYPTLGEGLKSTPYGQNVLVLDTTGKMTGSGKRRAYIRAIPSWDD